MKTLNEIQKDLTQKYSRSFFVAALVASLLFMLMCLMVPAYSQAAPERFELKSRARITKEKTEKANLVQKVRPEKIKDLETRKAVQELVNFIQASR